MALETGTVVTLWRYPVKSMRGEELAAAEVTPHGLLGDRAYALIDNTDGKAATSARRQGTATGFCRSSCI